jgi:hypothetical protein
MEAREGTEDKAEPWTVDCQGRSRERVAEPKINSQPLTFTRARIQNSDAWRRLSENTVNAGINLWFLVTK